MEVTIEWGALIGVAFGSSVVGAVVTQLFTTYRERSKHQRELEVDRREAAYLALRLATIFEQFAEDAASVVGDVSNFENSGGAVGSNSTRIPILWELPSGNERWRDIPIALTARVLGFDQYRRSVQEGISEYGRHADPPEVAGEMSMQCARLGCRALDVAIDLRCEYGLPELETSHDWPNFLRKNG